MTKTQIQEEISKLEELRDKSVDKNDKEFYNDLISQKKVQLRQIVDQELTTGQKVGGTIGRVGGSLIGIFMATVDDCINGNTDKKTTQRKRGKYADGGEAIGNAIGDVAEKITDAIKRRKK